MGYQGRHIEGKETRLRLLNSATELIAAQGYASTSISQICKTANAKPASLYWAFGNKEGLLAEVMETQAKTFFDKCENVIEHGANLDHHIGDLAEIFASQPEFLRLLLVLSLERRQGEPAIIEAARRVRQKARAMIGESYRRRLTHLSAEEAEPIVDRLARMFLMMLDGMFVAQSIDANVPNMLDIFDMIISSVNAAADRWAEV